MFADSASGRDTHRPQLDGLLGFVRDGDTVIVHSMDRLAHNLEDLRGLVRTLTGHGVRVDFVTEQLTFTGPADVRPRRGRHRATRQSGLDDLTFSSTTHTERNAKTPICCRRHTERHATGAPGLASELVKASESNRC